ncbi:cytochrome b5-related protein-like [Diorhabda carinulata]|uniref:cytochrome b5-related protein-like n=1 Tax=Diorhabda carinulata TaxID=1163345 RepID=UPI0025A2923E|nr:cytochrome b5-related protein-like [Diorhabda carinulata]XP_057671433.1 cytochrome b5-related protein-like [Diorhabda carinulata]
MEIVKGAATFTKTAIATSTSWLPSSPEYKPKSSLGIVPPKTRYKLDGLITPDQWLESRKNTDGAEGLWRIHDKLYDFTSFIGQHPGGKDWLILTKGTDISEIFESHHISDLPEQMIRKYFVKEAITKRNVPFTFDEDGFYRTLKREVRKSLNDIPKNTYCISDLYSDGLLFLLFLFSTLAVKWWSFTLATAAGVALGLLTIAAHNYVHRKDNLRMFYLQFSLLQIREWRITHCLSHHPFTNTIIDLEIMMVEPFLQFLPYKKIFGGYFSLVVYPFTLTLSFPGLFMKRLMSSPSCNYKNIDIKDTSGLILPIFMFITGKQTIFYTVLMWCFILLVGSYIFTLIGLSAAHHHPDVFHDGDTPRTSEEYDWGISQLDAVMERKDITGSDFLVLTTFGDHCLHHMFPTLDHSTLKYLYPTLEKVMRQFDLNLRLISQIDAAIGAVQQMIKVEPNQSPPDLKKNEMFPRCQT